MGDQSACPLCGAQNQCVINQQGDVDISLCWCSRVSIDSVELKKRLNEMGKAEADQSCICPQCAKNYST